MSYERRILLLSAISLILLWLASVFPLFSVLIEFPKHLCDSTTVGWFFARYWGSFFIYPTFLSSFALIAIYIPMTTAIRFISKNRFYLISCLAFLVFMTIGICFVEFSDSPLAAFEIPRDGISTPLIWADIQHMCNHDQKINFAQYQADIADQLKNGRSFTEIAYHLGVVVQSFSQLIIFICLAVFIGAGDSGIRRAAILLPRANLFILGCAIFFGSIWCFFRMAYRADENSIFVFEQGRLFSGYSGDYVTVMIYAISLGAYLMVAGSQLKAIESKLSQLIALATYVCGIGLAKIADPEFVTSLIGSRSSLGNILFLALSCTFVSFLSMMFAIRDPGNIKNHHR